MKTTTGDDVVILNKMVVVYIILFLAIWYNIFTHRLIIGFSMWAICLVILYFILQVCEGNEVHISPHTAADKMDIVKKDELSGGERVVSN